MKKIFSSALLRGAQKNKKTTCALLRCALRIKQINCGLYSSILQTQNVLWLFFNVDDPWQTLLQVILSCVSRELTTLQLSEKK